MNVFKLVALVLSLMLCALMLGACAAPRLGSDKSWWLDKPITDRNSDKNLTSKIPTRKSFYLPMKDGVLIATDLYLPLDYQSGQKLPAILLQTRYYRAFDVRWPASIFAERHSTTIKNFTNNGYAVVSTDTRGSGASFGSIDAPWSPAEVYDGSDLVSWIIQQPWSDGKIGSLGTSYDGTAAEMLLTTRHPAIKAVAPRFALFDCYTDVAFPGGIHLNWFTKNWALGNKALDSGNTGLALGFFKGLFLRGALPVDEDYSRTLIREAVLEHENNHDVFKDMLGITYREDRTERGFSFADVCPFGFISELKSTKAPVYSYSGWFDGAYQTAAINRFLTIKNPGSRLILGPWDHGGKQNISPYSPGRAPAFSHQLELIRFFDRYLKNKATGIEKENPVWYYTMGEEKWHSALSWPPAGGKKVDVFLSDASTLSYAPPVVETASDSYKVNNQAGTGDYSRWNSLFNTDSRSIEYLDRRDEDKKLLVYDTNPLQDDLIITGSPIIKLYLAASTKDVEVFVYLEDVSPDGSVQYITEGELRALHRKESKDAPLYNTMGVNRSFSREDAENLVPGKTTELRFELLATSYQFKKGHRIRVAIAGADKDHFSFISGESPTFRIERSAKYPSKIELPVYGLN